MLIICCSHLLLQVRELEQLRSKLVAQDTANVQLIQMEQKATAAADAARAQLRQLQDSMAPMQARIR
jgi:hypothetical protein